MTCRLKVRVLSLFLIPFFLMTFQHLLLYFLAGLACGSGFLVIRSRSPVHSVLALIFSFVQSSLLLLLLEIDVLALIFLIVYVGAIAILFLFVVMMLNVKVAEVRANLLPYFPLGFLFLGLFYLDLGVASLGSIPNDIIAFSPIYIQ
jgi:NADH-quinone oxidoreductase subunit J